MRPPQRRSCIAHPTHRFPPGQSRPRGVLTVGAGAPQQAPWPAPLAAPGRDGAPSECILYFAKRDVPRILNLLHRGKRSREQFQRELALVNQVGPAQDECEKVEVKPFFTHAARPSSQREHRGTPGQRCCQRKVPSDNAALPELGFPSAPNHKRQGPCAQQRRVGPSLPRRACRCGRTARTASAAGMPSCWSTLESPGRRSAAGTHPLRPAAAAATAATSAAAPCARSMAAALALAASAAGRQRLAEGAARPLQQVSKQPHRSSRSSSNRSKGGSSLQGRREPSRCSRPQWTRVAGA